MPVGTIVGQILLELLSGAVKAIEAAKIIGKAHAENRDITDDELKELDAKRDALYDTFKDAVRRYQERNKS